mmetsp:Transcript_35760/g.47057  ORF Transcript_35760/g.47057 Transcript_35760/m.47057 type:complete len:105 (+) Transcript_35760:786-1100(+)
MRVTASEPLISLCFDCFGINLLECKLFHINSLIRDMFLLFKSIAFIASGLWPALSNDLASASEVWQIGINALAVSAFAIARLIGFLLGADLQFMGFFGNNAIHA